MINKIGFDLHDRLGSLTRIMVSMAMSASSSRDIMVLIVTVKFISRKIRGGGHGAERS